MSKAETCVRCGRVIPEDSQYCVICGQKPKQRQRQIDRIRNMSVEELARFLHKTAEKTETCEDCPINDFCEERITRLGCSVAMFIEWLESEVTE